MHLCLRESTCDDDTICCRVDKRETSEQTRLSPAHHHHEDQSGKSHVLHRLSQDFFKWPGTGSVSAGSRSPGHLSASRRCEAAGKPGTRTVADVKVSSKGSFIRCEDTEEAIRTQRMKRICERSGVK
ncbi:unnamed protein product [Pleuronectes platessa]|uniref:Uncharacterized protein n=1 Tax=Pleuronectes platessa TaxID=8262 RepID=A0A9N7VP99_PLEPL|nr:unnamed protein product [Pleuronectes platessa]